MLDTEYRELKAKRVMKDAIFTEAFKEKQNVLELYNQLHSNDIAQSEDEIGILTLRNILTTGPVNDLGFIAKNKVLCLIEAQSSQLNTILLRSLVYLGRTYERYITEKGKTFYDVSEEDIPLWEIYIIYTEKAGFSDGAQMWKFNMIPSNLLDLDHKDIIPISEGGIVEEYVSLCKVVDNLISEHGYEKPTLKGVLEYCREHPGSLTNFVLTHESEIMGLYEEMWTQEGNIEMRIRVAEREARERGLEEGRTEGRTKGLAEGRAEGLKEGRAEGRAEGIAEGLREGKQEGRKEGIEEGIREGKEEGRIEEREKLAVSFYESNVPIDIVSKNTGLSEERISELASKNRCKIN